MPCAPVLKRRDVISHPQVVESGILMESNHPDAGPLRQARPAALFSETAPQFRHGGPALGADTDRVLAEIGYEESDIEALRAQGVIGPRLEAAAE